MVLSEGSFKGGFKTGQWIFYDSSGNLDEIGSFKIGLRDGLWGRFHANNNIKQEEKYINGKLLYVSNFFTTNGFSIDKGSFENGNGEILDYYDDESIFTRSSYKDGYLNGNWIMYYPNGKIAETGKYKLNDKIGTWFKYNKRGLKISVNEFN